MSYTPRPVPDGLRGFRWLAWSALFASQIGVWFVLSFRDPNVVTIGAAFLSLVGLVIAARRCSQQIVMLERTWLLCDQVYGPVVEGATVTLHPTPGAPAAGEVIVEYPDTPGVS